MSWVIFLSYVINFLEAYATTLLSGVNLGLCSPNFEGIEKWFSMLCDYNSDGSGV